MSIIYCLRHEERPDDPRYFTTLTEQGLQRAHQLCDTLPHVTHIYSSPFVRCLQTIRPYCLHRHLRVCREFSLYERTEDPRFTPTNYLVDEVPSAYTTMVEPEYTSFLVPGDVRHNETPAQVQERAQRFLEHLQGTHGEHDVVLLVSHLSVINALLNREDAAPLAMGQLVQMPHHSNLV